MPYEIQNLSMTRHDPQRVGSPAYTRPQTRIIGNRSLPPGEKMSMSDEMYARCRAQIEDLVSKKVIRVAHLPFQAGRDPRFCLPSVSVLAGAVKAEPKETPKQESQIADLPVMPPVDETPVVTPPVEEEDDSMDGRVVGISHVEAEALPPAPAYEAPEVGQADEPDDERAALLGLVSDEPPAPTQEETVVAPPEEAPSSSDTAGADMLLSSAGPLMGTATKRPARKRP